MKIRRKHLKVSAGVLLIVMLVLVGCNHGGGLFGGIGGGCGFWSGCPNETEAGGDVPALPVDEAANPCPPDCDAIDPGNIPPLSGSVCGAACDPSVGANCVGGLECISGTCQNAEMCMGCGQTCNSDADCPAEFECTTDNICYNKSLCQNADPAMCGNTCTGDVDCAPGLECYQTEQGYCWAWDPNDSCTGPGCGDACNIHTDCGSGQTCIVWGFCGGTHSSVCDGCGASCETNADCPANMECIDDGYHNYNICWSESTCETSEFQFPQIDVDLVATEVLIDPETGFPIDPFSGFPIDPQTFLPINPETLLPFPPTACVDDGICTGGEKANGSCRDCSPEPGDACGVACPTGVCGGGLSCVDGRCWNAQICGPDDGGGGNNDKDDDDKDNGGSECTCHCVDFASGRRCADSCTGAVCEP